MIAKRDRRINRRDARLWLTVTRTNRTSTHFSPARSTLSKWPQYPTEWKATRRYSLYEHVIFYARDILRAWQSLFEYFSTLQSHSLRQISWSSSATKRIRWLLATLLLRHQSHVSILTDFHSLTVPRKQMWRRRLSTIRIARLSLTISCQADSTKSLVKQETVKIKISISSFSFYTENI